METDNKNLAPSREHSYRRRKRPPRPLPIRCLRMRTMEGARLIRERRRPNVLAGVWRACCPLLLLLLLLLLPPGDRGDQRHANGTHRPRWCCQRRWRRSRTRPDRDKTAGRRAWPWSGACRGCVGQAAQRVPAIVRHPVVGPRSALPLQPAATRSYSSPAPPVQSRASAIALECYTLREQSGWKT